MSESISTISLALVGLTTLTVLLAPRWRWIILAVALQYVAVFLLVSRIWPISLAAVKLIAGWMACAVLGASHHGDDSEDQRLSISARIFRLIGGLLVFVLVYSITQKPQSWIPLEQPLLATGLILIGMGLFQLGLAGKTLNVIIGLLTTLSGFEVIYAGLVSSVLVTGLLSVVTLGLALVGAYWMILQAPEENP